MIRMSQVNQETKRREQTKGNNVHIQKDLTTNNLR